MNLDNPADIDSLPSGSIDLIFNGQKISYAPDADMVASAAGAVSKLHLQTTFNTKAEIVAAAINEAEWGLGRHGYKAEATPQPVTLG